VLASLSAQRLSQGNQKTESNQERTWIFFAVIFNPSATVETMKPQAAAMQSQMISMSDKDFSKTQPVMLGSTVESPDGLKQATRWALESDRKVVAQATYDDLTTDMRPRLTSIRAPIVLIYPWEPALVTKEQVDSFYITQCAGAAIFKSRRIEGSRHFIMFDQPQLFADAISTFLPG
jgi:pimeloyl-ACP methyl ester carboxylesterase